MPPFTATIPGRPSDAPGDIYPSDPISDWHRYELRAARSKWTHPSSPPGLNASFQIENRGMTVTEIVLAEGGAEPSPWVPIEKTNSTIALVKVDYTRFQREYATVTLRKYRKVTIRFRIHYLFLPPTSYYDRDWEETWFSPLGNAWSIGPAVETRRKLTSWGAGLQVSISGGVVVEIGTQLDFSHEGEDLTTPSAHPTPWTTNLSKKEPEKDDSLEQPAPASEVGKLRIAEVLQPRDRQPLTEVEMAAARAVTVDQLAGVNLESIARSISSGQYPGLVRHLIDQGRTVPPQAEPPVRPSEVPTPVLGSAHGVDLGLDPNWYSLTASQGEDDSDQPRGSSKRK